MGIIIKLFFSGFIEALKSIFGRSTEESLGVDETKLKGANELIKEVSDAKEIDDANGKLSLAALRVRTQQWKRPD